jgi:hypothetical protein
MLDVDLGEVYAIRAMAYFYLVRIYRDVPYINFPYTDDTEDFKIAKLTDVDILKNIVADLEMAEQMVVFAHGFSSLSSSELRIKTKGRFNKNSVRALLADVYLWQAACTPAEDTEKRAEIYRKCVAVCDRIEIMDEVEIERADPNLFTGAELLMFSNKGQSGTSAGSSNSYLGVFFNENSFESIFELQFDNQTKNNKIRDYYGRTGEAARINASDLNTFGLFAAQPDDVRHYDSYAETAKESGEFRIYKYVGTRRFGNEYSDYGYLTQAGVEKTNWIFYRVPDVYLMKAEALVELNQLDDALELVNLVYIRSNPNAQNLFAISYPTQDAMRELVLLERQREFLFEGKRWFDLVRTARREGSSKSMVEKYIMRNATYNAGVLVTKLSVMDALYLPIHRKELLSNTELIQNPFYEKNDIK